MNCGRMQTELLSLTFGAARRSRRKLPRCCSRAFRRRIQPRNAPSESSDAPCSRRRCRRGRWGRALAEDAWLRLFCGRLRQSSCIMCRCPSPLLTEGGRILFYGGWAMEDGGRRLEVGRLRLLDVIGWMQVAVWGWRVEDIGRRRRMLMDGRRVTDNG